MKYLGEDGLKALIQKIKNSAGGGTGNVSSDTINSIQVVDSLPETEVEGVLYLVKETIENPTEPTNLWVNPTVLTGNYIDSSIGYIGTQDIAYSAYISCESNTTYKITRTMSGYRFIIGSYSSVPKDGSTTSNFTVANSLSEVTFTTGSTDTYLAIYYFGGSETLDATELLNDIVVTKVESNNLFKTSDTLYSNSGSTYTSPATRGGIIYTYDTNSETINLDGTTNDGVSQGFKQSETLESGKTYRFYATIDSGNVSIGSKTYALLLEIKSTYNGSPLAECYVSPTDSSSNPTQDTYTPSSSLTEWYVMISQRSSEVSFDNCNITIHIEEV